MKKIIIIAILFVGCVSDAAIDNKKGYIISRIEQSETSKNCIYTCKKMNVVRMSFGDTCGKYKVGDTIHFYKK